jgi:hypothetical protein
MARLTLVQKRGKFALSLPHKILIDGHLLGVMKDREVSVEMPAGAYDITVQSMVPMISATQHVELPLRGEVRLEFSDREQVWDALFVVDVVLWVVKRFLHLASPWTWLYEVFTNGYFVLWLIYEWRIRNHYFKFELH